MIPLNIIMNSIVIYQSILVLSATDLSIDALLNLKSSKEF